MFILHLVHIHNNLYIPFTYLQNCKRRFEKEPFLYVDKFHKLNVEVASFEEISQAEIKVRGDIQLDIILVLVTDPPDVFCERNVSRLKASVRAVRRYLIFSVEKGDYLPS